MTGSRDHGGTPCKLGARDHPNLYAENNVPFDAGFEAAVAVCLLGLKSAWL